MKALRYTAPGGPDVIQLGDAPTPVPGPGQIRVQVRASALNRADILQRKGRYPAPPGWPADIPGLEYAGQVEALGAPPAGQPSRWKVGDRVMGLVGGGAQAEYVVVHQDEALAIPDRLSFEEAAAIPEAFLTAWDALTVRGRLQPGERVLIHAVGSGVGTAAVQLALLLGAHPVGTSRSAAKLEQATALGLVEAIDTGRPGLLLRERLSAPVDVILDVLGGPAFGENLDALAPRGRLVLLGFLQGPETQVSLEPMLRKRLEVIGTVMRTRLQAERIPLVRDFAERVTPELASGRLRAIVSHTYPMAEAAAAHGAMERDENFGKVVLVW